MTTLNTEALYFFILLYRGGLAVHSNQYNSNQKFLKLFNFMMGQKTQSPSDPLMFLAFPTPFSSLYMLFKRRGNSIFLPFNWFVSIQIEDFSCTSLSRLPSTNLCFHPYSKMLLFKMALLFIMAQGHWMRH